MKKIASKYCQNSGWISVIGGRFMIFSGYKGSTGLGMERIAVG